MSAKIIIEFERILLSGSPDYYFLHTTVLPDSEPGPVVECLVVDEQGVSSREEMKRIAAFTDIPLLDAITVVKASVSNPLGLTPAVGDRYIVDPPGAGAWAGKSNAIATWLGSSWSFIDAAIGMAAWDEETEQRLEYIIMMGGHWIPTPGGGLELLPESVNQFEDSALPFGLAVVGDIVKIVSSPMPPIWDEVMASPASLFYEVVEILDPPNNSRLRVVPYTALGTTALPPTPELSLEYNLYDSSLVLKHGPVGTGSMDRVFDGLGPGPYRTSEHYDLFLDATVANNRVNALRVQADTLVSQINDDTYTGTTTETFE